MPKYYCDYCDIFLTHDSINVRKAHNAGWKHRMQVQNYYSALSQDKVDAVMGQITKAYEGRPMPNNSSSQRWVRPANPDLALGPHNPAPARPQPLGAPFGVPQQTQTAPQTFAPPTSTSMQFRPVVPGPISYRPVPRVMIPDPVFSTSFISNGEDDQPSKKIKGQ